MKTSRLPDGREIAMYALTDRKLCPQCGMLAVVPLTPGQLAKQPDDTTHVCHPAFDGCNHGFGPISAEPTPRTRHEVFVSKLRSFDE